MANMKLEDAPPPRTWEWVKEWLPVQMATINESYGGPMQFLQQSFTTTEAMQNLMTEVLKRTMEFITTNRMLEKGHDPEFDNIKKGDIVCFNKSEDVDRGLVFGPIEESVGSDFIVKPTNSDSVTKMSKQRIILLPRSSQFEVEDRELKLMETKS